MKKMKLGFAASKKRPPAVMAMTSLMDVLTIILIFLLVNFKEEPQAVDMPKFVNLPKLNSRATPNFTEDIRVAIGRHQMDIDGHPIHYRSFDLEREHIMNQAATILSGIKQAKQDKGETPKITLKADEATRYDVIDSFILAASSAGITNIELIAMAEK